jgi:hypothetical protein
MTGTIFNKVRSTSCRTSIDIHPVMSTFVTTCACDMTMLLFQCQTRYSIGLSRLVDGYSHMKAQVARGFS